MSDKKIKLIYVLSGTGVYGGGTKTFLLLLYRLIKHNIQILVVCPDKEGVYKVLEDQGIPVVCLRKKYIHNTYPSFRGFKNFVLFLPKLLYILLLNEFAYLNLKKIQRTFNADIIHTNVGVIDIGYRVAKKFKIPHIYHIREYQDLDFGMKIIPSMAHFKRKIRKPFNFSICITKDIQKHFGLNKNISKVIYDSVVPSSNNNDTLESKLNYFLFAGRVQEAKGTEEAVIAFLEFKKTDTDNVELYIAGSHDDSDYLAKIVNIIDSSEYPASIKFLGARDDIAELMSRALALIVPSPNEGFGLITAEAMYNYCLVVGRNNAGTKEQFDNGLELFGEEIGLRYNTLEQLIEHLKFAKNADHSKMINLAYKAVKILYSDDINSNNVYDLYNKLLR